MLFARKALLVEGPGDRLAARIVAEKIGLDLDAEDLAVVVCAPNCHTFRGPNCKSSGRAFRRDV